MRKTDRRWMLRLPPEKDGHAVALHPAHVSRRLPPAQCSARPALRLRPALRAKRNTEK